MGLLQHISKTELQQVSYTRSFCPRFENDIHIFDFCWHIWGCLRTLHICNNFLSIKMRIYTIIHNMWLVRALFWRTLREFDYLYTLHLRFCEAHRKYKVSFEECLFFSIEECRFLIIWCSGNPCCSDFVLGVWFIRLNIINV